MVENNDEIDRLIEATNGRYHLNDPGMEDYETGWEEFKLGTRVEVRTTGNIWLKGTVVATPEEKNYTIIVKCDEPWRDKCKFIINIHKKTRRKILADIRKIDESHYEVPISFKNSSSSKYK